MYLEVRAPQAAHWIASAPERGGVSVGAPVDLDAVIFQPAGVFFHVGAAIALGHGADTDVDDRYVLTDEALQLFQHARVLRAGAAPAAAEEGVDLHVFSLIDFKMGPAFVERFQAAHAGAYIPGVQQFIMAILRMGSSLSIVQNPQVPRLSWNTSASTW